MACSVAIVRVKLIIELLASSRLHHAAFRFDLLLLLLLLTISDVQVSDVLLMIIDSLCSHIAKSID